MRTRWASILVLLFAGALDAAAHCDHNLWTAPSTIHASPDGNFYAEATLLIGDTELSFATSFLEGMANVADGPVVDGFCLVTHFQGDELRFAISGTLIHPAKSGSVRLHVTVCTPCGDRLFQADVAIVPSSVPTERSSWGTLKSSFDSR